MMRLRLLSALAVAIAALSSCAAPKALPQWRQGNLDIHFINNARGEGYLCIFPDGTTMMVDAGDTKGAGGAYAAMPPRKPDSLTTGADAYINYIRHFLPKTNKGKLDYILLSHFHQDHYGDVRLARSNEFGYRHFCLAAVYDALGADVLLDRSWPNYNSRAKNTSKGLEDVAAFAHHAQSEGTKVEQFKLGSDTQIAMRHGGDYDFKVTNIGVNCATFSAQGDTVTTAFNSENAACCCFHMKYGCFDFVASGDLTGQAQNAWADNWYATFKPSVDVYKANHHLHHNAWDKGMVRQGFKSQTIFGYCFGKTDDKHVTVPVLQKAAAAGDVFITNAYEGSVKEYPEAYAGLKDYNGHFVVRVSPGGKNFKVYKLQDTDYKFKVLATYGPYSCEE